MHPTGKHLDFQLTSVPLIQIDTILIDFSCQAGDPSVGLATLASLGGFAPRCPSCSGYGVIPFHFSVFAVSLNWASLFISSAI